MKTYFLIVLGLLLLDYFQTDSQPALDKFNLELVFWTSRAQRILIGLDGFKKDFFLVSLVMNLRSETIKSTAKPTKFIRMFSFFYIIL